MLEQAQAQAALAAQSVGRRQEVSAARATVDAARATLSQRDWAVAQKSPAAPVSALVYDTFFVPGEWVPSGRPVVSLLPPGNIKLRFYVPEPEVGGIKVGQRVAASCDGCGAEIPATVTYVSVRPEYTPPVIYSRQERAKLVFLVEARPEPDQAQRLKPGQPLDVRVKQ
jgi:HlyD family secretion protein